MGLDRTLYIIEWEAEELFLVTGGFYVHFTIP